MVIHFVKVDSLSFWLVYRAIKPMIYEQMHKSEIIFVSVLSSIGLKSGFFRFFYFSSVKFPPPYWDFPMDENGQIRYNTSQDLSKNNVCVFNLTDIDED